MDFKKLSDSELERETAVTVLEESKIQTRVLHLLAEIERRRFYSKNHPSLFEYCVKVLKYSASSAQRRIDTMRAMKLIPEIEEKLLTGDLNLSVVSQAQSFFRQEAKCGKKYSVVEKREVLQKLENKSTRDCAKELASISPQTLSVEKRRVLNLSQCEIKTVLSNEVLSKMDQIKALLSHSRPGMTDAELIEFMTQFTLEKLSPARKVREKKVHVKKLLPTPVLGRYIPAKVKREVWLRDKGRCAHPGCRSTHFLEYDHIQPVSLGGPSTKENLRLLCRTHNQWAAVEKLGVETMRPYFR